MPGVQFDTHLSYTSRSDKPAYVIDKYRPLFTDSVLDVGADRGQLGSHLPDSIQYLPVGLGPDVAVEIDLESGRLPFNDDEFNCVVCLEVLEHIDNIYEVFDELCRVAKSSVIVSLPNPWASFLGMLLQGYYDGPKVPMKYYNLPPTPPDDRHKWFFGAHEAEKFIRERAEFNGYDVVQIDQEWSIDHSWIRALAMVLLRVVVNRQVSAESLLRANTWGVIDTSN